MWCHPTRAELLRGRTPHFLLPQTDHPAPRARPGGRAGHVACVGLSGQSQTCVPAADSVRAGWDLPGWAGSVCAQGTAGQGEGEAGVEVRVEDGFVRAQAAGSAGNSATAWGPLFLHSL